MPPAEPAAVHALSLSEARRLALAAQGFGNRRSARTSGWPRIRAATAGMGLLQLDSVSVLVRSHYLPVYSRIGDYDRAALDRRSLAPTRRAYFEYWAHEASLVPLELHPLMRWRMARAERFEGGARWLAGFFEGHRDYVDAVLREVAERGPLTAGELSDPGERSGPWWGWHRGKSALEFLFWTGAVTAHSRRGFERVYDLAERVIPEPVRNLPTPDERDAFAALAEHAARALGVATELDIRDYFRLPVADARRAVADLVEAGTLLPARVEGWPGLAYLHRDAAAPATLRPTALLSPFDPLVWFRPRTERLFGFHYRIELYTPQPKRRFGYYVLPFLEAGRLTARVDLKADRSNGRLLVLGAYTEEGAAGRSTPERLAAELRHLAGWLGLGDVSVSSRGDLAEAVAGRLR